MPFKVRIDGPATCVCSKPRHKCTTCSKKTGDVVPMDVEVLSDKDTFIIPGDNGRPIVVQKINIEEIFEDVPPPSSKEEVVVTQEMLNEIFGD